MSCMDVRCSGELTLFIDSFVTAKTCEIYLVFLWPNSLEILINVKKGMFENKLLETLVQINMTKSLVNKKVGIHKNSMNPIGKWRNTHPQFAWWACETLSMTSYTANCFVSASDWSASEVVTREGSSVLRSLDLFGTLPYRTAKKKHINNLF